MKAKQKQWQLYYLGYYGESVDDIDGIFGPKSKAATSALQDAVGINVDGVFGTHTRNKTKEIISAIQEVLKQRVEPTLVVDGLAGPATMAATAKYQTSVGLNSTGFADTETLSAIQNEPDPEPEVSTDTGDWWDKIEYFTREELKCKCGGRYCDGFPAEPQKMTVMLADRARKHFGKPAHNVSFLRCRQHNANSGGVANSQHMYGEAMDIRIDGVSANELYSFFKKQPEVRYTYKINNTNVHFDIPKGAR